MGYQKSTPTEIELSFNREETSLVRHVDCRIIPFIFLLHLASFLDRVNIGHARLYGFERGINITSDQYSLSLSVFFIGYVLFEVPSNLIMKRIPPPKWIAIIMVGWGLATMVTAAVSSFTQLIISRFVLGIAEAGFFPGIIHYLSFWYTRKEQGFRIAILTCASITASAISGPISYLIKGLDQKGGLASWQWIFLVEGIPTVLLGCLTWFLMPDSPRTANWLTPTQRKLLTDRLTASYINTTAQKFEVKQFVNAFTDYKTYFYMVLYFSFMLPMYSVALLMPTIIKDLKFTTEQTMLLTCPPYIFTLFFNILLSYNSDRTLNRGFHIMVAALSAITGFIILLKASSQYFRYAAIFLVAAGVSSATAPTLSWSNNNLMGTTKAATASALIIMFGNIGGIIAGQLYKPKDAPNYALSHTINIIFLSWTLLLAMGLRLCLQYENKKLDLLATTKPGESEVYDMGVNSTFRFIL